MPGKPPGTIAGIVERQLLFLDGTRHDAVQDVLRKPLGRLAQEVQPFLQETVMGLLAHGRQAGRMDLVGEFASPLSRLLIAHVLGIPTHDPSLLVQLERWSDAFADVTSGQIRTNLPGIISLYAYFQQLIEQKRRQPTGDLLSVYVAAADQGLRDREEIVSDGMMLFAAGRATLRKLIPAVAWAWLRSDLSQWSAMQHALHDRPALIAPLAEEGLRWATPTSYVARWTTREVMLDEQVIPAGTKVFASLADANFDERCFPEAHRFAYERHPNRHLTFGAGSHVCTGAPLARKAAQAVFAALLALPGLTLETDQTLPLFENANIGGLMTCPVALA